MKTVLIKKIIDLLNTTVCPNCDGSGSLGVMIKSPQYVTKEMASDAGDPLLEGSLYTEEEWEQQECQWCYEKNQIIAELKKNE